MTCVRKYESFGVMLASGSWVDITITWDGYDAQEWDVHQSNPPWSSLTSDQRQDLSERVAEEISMNGW